MSSLLNTTSIALSLFLSAAPAKEEGPRTSERTIVGDQLTFVLRASPVSNLTYQLDCIADFFPCSREAYVALWKDSLGWDAEDEKRLAEWKTLRQKYWEQVPFAAPTSKVPPGLPPRFDGVDLDRKFRAAGLAADSVETYRGNLELVLKTSDVDRALAVIGHFQPRFDAWWRSTASSKLAPFLDETAALLQQDRLSRLIEQAARFYETTLATGARVQFDLMFRPPGGSKSSNGEQIENHAIVEVLEGERPEARIDVVLHELFHHFSLTAPGETVRSVQDALFRKGGDEAVGAWALMEESVAAGLGNGLVARMVLSPEKFARLLSREGGFYNDSLIDPAAKALMPVLEKALERGYTRSSQGFIDEYLKAMRAALGSELSGRAARLKIAALVYDDSFGDVARELTSIVKSSSTYSNSPVNEAKSRSRLERYADLTGAVFVSSRKLSELDGWKGLLPDALGKIRREARSGKPFVYGVRAPRGRFIYVFVGPDADSIRSLIPAFLKENAPCEGVCARAPAVRRVSE